METTNLKKKSADASDVPNDETNYDCEHEEP